MAITIYRKNSFADGEKSKFETRDFLQCQAERAEFQ